MSAAGLSSTARTAVLALFRCSRKAWVTLAPRSLSAISKYHIPASPPGSPAEAKSVAVVGNRPPEPSKMILVRFTPQQASGTSGCEPFGRAVGLEENDAGLDTHGAAQVAARQKCRQGVVASDYIDDGAAGPKVGPL